MTNWLDRARGSRRAAVELPIEREYAPSIISRAYYAAYSRVVAELSWAGYQPPSAREGPSHAGTHRLIVVFLVNLRREHREALAQVVDSLYALRITADYQASVEVDEADARRALSLMKIVFDTL